MQRPDMLKGGEFKKFITDKIQEHKKNGSERLLYLSDIKERYNTIIYNDDDRPKIPLTSEYQLLVK